MRDERSILELAIADRGEQGRFGGLQVPGDDPWGPALTEPGAHLHLYGKGTARPGRKMGHITRVAR